ncbi:MAG TPA: Ig-like domain repeat protein [Pirellulales bacterium]|nr:Ig-like domain repeat protein [Pirellulales bacterium]
MPRVWQPWKRRKPKPAAGLARRRERPRRRWGWPWPVVWLRLERLEDRALLATFDWTGAAGTTDWDTAGNWSVGGAAATTLPGSADDVVINSSTNTAVVHGANVFDQVNSITLSSPDSLTLSAGTLQVVAGGSGGSLSGNGTFDLAGGTLSDAVVAAGATVTAATQPGTLNGVTLDGTLDLATNNGAVAHVSSGLTLGNGGLIEIGNTAGSTFGNLFFDGANTLGVTSGATGTIVLGANTNNIFSELGAQALTIASGVTIKGADGAIGSGNGTLTNQGTIDADTSGGTFNVALGKNGSNTGTIEATSGGSLTVFGNSSGTWTNTLSGTISIAGGGTLGIDDLPSDPWTNSGTISSTGSTVNLDGSFAQAGLGTFTRDAASTVNLTGLLTGNLTLASGTGSWNLAGGELSGGTFSASGGATLFATATNGSTLNAETLDSPIDFFTNTFTLATVTNGLTLDNVTLDLGNSSGSTFGNLFFNSNGNGNQTLGVTSGATGTIVLGANTNNILSESQGFGQSLTIASGITIEGDNGTVGNNFGTLTNNGVINADTSGGTLNVALGKNGSNAGTIEATSGGSLTVFGNSGGTWTNTGSGTISIAGGGTLSIDDSPADPWTNSGTISSTGSTVNLDGAFTQADLGTFTRDAASTVNLSGDLIGNLALDGATGSWNLTGGELGAPPIGSTTGGGTFSASGGATLFATAFGGTLNAETLASPIDFSTNNFTLAHVTGGSLTLDNVTLDLGNSSGSTSANLFFNGVETLGGGATGTIVLGGNTNNLLSGTALTIGTGITIKGDNGTIGSGNGTLTNNGTINADVSGGTLTLSGSPITNDGTLAAAGGTLALNAFNASGSVANYATGTLTGGVWQAGGGGTLWLVGDPITTDAANLTVDGPASSMTSNLRNASTVNALAGLSDIASTGSLSLLNGNDLTTNGALTNSGTLTLGAGATAASTLTVGGNYTQAAGATLNAQIGGTPASGLFGQLAASGSSSGAALAGTLNVSLANAFSPAAGQSFPLITTGAANGRTGTFATVNVPSLAGGLAFTSQYNANNFTLATTSSAVATKLVFSQQPTNTTAGQTIDSSGGVQVEIVDQSGNVLTSDTSNVTIAVASPSGGKFASGTLTEAAVKGVATFKDLVIDAAGSYTLSASDTDSGVALTGATSNSFAVNPAAASKLVFTAQPKDTVSGQTIDGTSGVQVAIEDQFGNVVTSDTSNVTIAVAGGPGTFASGTLTEAAVAGVATFKDLVIDTAGSYTLSASDTDNGVALTGATSNRFAISPAATSQLVFTAQPANTTAGQTIDGTSGVVVSIEDQFGNVETGDTSNVTIAVLSGPGAFASGTLTVAAVKGVATFSNLVIDQGGSYTLSASDVADAIASVTSSSFAVTPAAAGKLAFTAQPANTTSGQTINGTSGVQVTIEDQFGNVETGDTSNVTIAVASGPGTFAGGTLTEAAANGVATFKDLVIDTAGAYTLSAGDSADSLSGFNSNSFNVSALPTTTSVVVSSANPSVFGQIVTFTATVSSTATGTPGGIVAFDDGGTQLGTGTLQAGSGQDQATFATSSLAVGGHNITAVYNGDGNFQGSTSAVVVQTVNQAATTTTLVSSPNPSVAGQAVTFTATVTPTSPGAGTPSGQVFFREGDEKLGVRSLQVVNGHDQATLQLTLDAAGVAGVTAAYQGDGNFVGGASAVLDQTVNPAAASQLLFIQQPTAAAPGQTIAPAVTVQVQDQFGNVVTGDTSNVTIAIASPAGGSFASGTLTEAAVAGVATFSNLVIGTPGTYKLSASDTDGGVTLSGAVSSSFVVSLPTYTWTGLGKDNLWTDLKNWSVGGQTPTVLPGPSDAVVIPATVANDNFPLLQSGITVSVLSVSDGGQLTLAGTLQLPFSGTSDFSGGGSLTFQGGTLEDAHVDAATAVLGTIDGGILQSVTVDGTLDLAKNNDATLDVQGSLTLGDGALVLIGNADGGTQGELVFSGAQEILGTLGTAAIRLGASSRNLVGIGVVLTIGAGITIDGQSGTIGTAAPFGVGAGGAFFNYGTISADGAKGTGNPGTGGTITIDAAGWTNEGTVEASGGNNLVLTGAADNTQGVAWTNAAGATISITGSNSGGGTLTLNGISTSLSGGANWLNLGTISLNNATLDLGDGQVAGGGAAEQFTLAALGNFQRSGGTVVIQSTLTNSGDVMILDGNASQTSANQNTVTLPGSWIVGNGGQIVGGTVQTVNGAALIGGAQGRTIGVLDGIALNGTLDLSQSTAGVNAVHVRDGLVMLGGSQILIGNQSGSSSGELLFSGPQQGVSLPSDLAGLHLGAATVIPSTFSDIHVAGSTSGATSSGASTLAGTILFGANGANILAANLDANATLTIGAGIVIDGKNGDIGGLPGGGPGTPLDVNGTISADGGSGTSGVQTPSARLLIGIGGGPPPSGTLTVNTTDLINYVPGFDHLNGGTWEAANGNTLRLLGVNIKDNNASVILDGPASHIFSDTGTASALAGLYFIDFGGSLSLLDGAQLTLQTSQGSFGNNGSLTIGAGTATTGPSSLSVNGEYGQFGGGTLTFEIGGPPSGNLFGVLNATGNVFLDGTLNVDETNGFIPLAQNGYRVINAGGSVNGSFTTVTGQVLGQQLAFTPQYDNRDVTLVAELTLPVMEGAPFTLPLAVFDLNSTFTQFTQAQVNSQFSAHIDWGDGTTSAGSLFAGSQLNATRSGTGTVQLVGPGATVEGAHTYQETGDYAIQVTIFQNVAASFLLVGGGGARKQVLLATVLGVAAVAEAPLQTDVPTGTVVQTINGVATPVLTSFDLNASAFSGQEGQALPATTQVAQFVDLNPSLNPSARAGDFSAEIDWGDGTSSAGTVATTFDVIPSSPRPKLEQVFAVEGGHTYAEAGAYHVVATVFETFVAHGEPGLDLLQAIDRSAQIADVPLTLTPVPTQAIQGTEGIALTNLLLAQFTDANKLSQAGDFTATIQWGDGQTSVGTVSPSLVGFVVTGSHTYTGAGVDPITVTVDDRGGSQASITMDQGADIADQPLKTQIIDQTAQPFKPSSLEGSLFSGPLVAFVDPNLSSIASNFTATIDWGDGTVTAGTVQNFTGASFDPVNGEFQNAGNVYQVAGQHTYTTTSPAGGFPITVDVFDGTFFNVHETTYTNTMVVPTFADVATNIENGFSDINSNLDRNIFINPVPLVGQGLTPFADQIFQGLNAALVAAAATITRNALPGKPAPTEATAALLLFDAFGPTGLNLLIAPPNSNLVIITPTQLENSDGQTFNIILNQTPHSVGTTGFDFGLPGIPFKTSDASGVALQLGYTLDLNFTASAGMGIDPTSNATFQVQAKIAPTSATDPTKVPISGTMGLIPVTLTDSRSGFNGVYTIPLSGDAVLGNPLLHANGDPSLETVDFTKPDLTQKSGYSFKAATENFSITPSIEAVLPPEIPTMGSAINVSWSIGNPNPPIDPTSKSTPQAHVPDNPDPSTIVDGPDPSSIGDGVAGVALGEAPTVKFNDFTINLGSIFGPAFLPIVQEVQKVTKPLGSIVSTLEQPVPVLDQLFKLIHKTPPSYIDLILKLINTLSGASQQTVQTEVNDLQDINSVLKAINALQPQTGGGLSIQLGSAFSTTGDPRDSGRIPPVAPATTGQSVGGPSGFPVQALTIGTNTSTTDNFGLTPTTTTLASSANPSPDTPGGNSSVTFTATVSVTSPGTGTPTGTVAFFDGTQSLGTGTLQNNNGQFQATVNASFPPDSNHSITAVYQGDGTFLNSTSSALEQTVGTAATAGFTTLADFENLFTYTAADGSQKNYLDFPILDDPAKALDLLLGQNETIFQFNIPKVSINVLFNVPIIIPTPLLVVFVNLNFGGNFKASFSGTIGFDTIGLQDGNPLDGLFLDDVNFNLSVGIQAQAQVSLLEIVNVGGGANLDIGVNVTLVPTAPHQFPGPSEPEPNDVSDGTLKPTPPIDPDLVVGGDFEDGNLSIVVNPFVQAGINVNVSLGPFGVLGSWTLGIGVTVPLPGFSIGPQGQPVGAIHPTDIWTGQGLTNNWMDAANWYNDTVPAPGDNLDFPALAKQQTNVENFPNGTQFTSLTFGGSYIINGVNGNALVIGAGGITGTGYNTTVINFPYTLSTDPTITASDPGTSLVFNGAVNTAGLGLVFDGSGSTLLAGVVSGGGSITKKGNGQLMLGAANTYSGGTDIQDGTIIPTNNQGLGSGGVHVENGAHLLLAAPGAGNLVLPSGGFTVNAVEGADSGPQTVATFSDPGGSTAPGDYSATILWGDGGSSTGSITGVNGAFTVSGSHSYAADGASSSVTVVIAGPAGGAATADSTANVADASLTAAATTLPVLPGAPLNGVTVATFTDSGGAEAAANYSATIDWGDGSSTSPGTIVPAAGGGFDVTGSHIYADTTNHTIQVTIVDAGGAQTQAASQARVGDANAQYVAAAYLEVLGRPVDAAGLAFWDGRLDAGASRATVTALIDHSAEYFADIIITPAFQSYLGRAPDAAGLAYWVDQMRHHGLTDDQLEAGFIGSPEFFAKAGGTNTDWVEALYQVFLGRPADAGGLAYWTAQLAAGEGRAQVALGFAGGAERRRQRIVDDYMQYLGRQPDANGLAFWLAQLGAGVANEELITGFVAGDEFFQRHTGP